MLLQLTDVVPENAYECRFLFCDTFAGTSKKSGKPFFQVRYKAPCKVRATGAKYLIDKMLYVADKQVLDRVAAALTPGDVVDVVFAPSQYGGGEPEWIGIDRVYSPSACYDPM